MKKIFSILITGLLCSHFVQAQSAADIPSQVHDLLSQMPAPDQQTLQQDMQQVAALGAEGLSTLAALVRSDDGGVDSTVRYAVGSFSFAATQPGKEAWRSMSVTAYCNALHEVAGREAKAFLIRQLQITGNDEAVTCLQPFLQDSTLDGPAIRALEQINTANANDALLKALPTASDNTKISLIEALGRNHYTAAAKAIAPFAGSSHTDLRKVSLYALADIADPASAGILSRAAQKAGYTFAPDNATSSYLYYIQRLTSNGHAPQAIKEAERLVKKSRKETHTNHAATVLLAAAKDRLPFTLSKEEKKEGFKILFNGTSMDQWTGNLQDYTMEDGTIAIHPGDHGGHGNLYTKDEYGNFIFRFEFQLTPGANNGIGIRAPLEGDAAYVGMEIQVLDNTAEMYKELQPYQYHGSVYGVIPAKRGFLKPVGEWNQEEIVAQGTHIKVTLNGTVIVDGDIAEASKNGTMDHRDHPGLKRTTGHIGFLGHGTTVRFRNIRVKDLGMQ